MNRAVRVQVAGISTVDDALACEAAGVDAIGFTVGLPGGPHNGLDEAGAAAIIRALPPFVVPVLITYRVRAAEVVAMCRAMGVSQVQLHAPATGQEVAAMRAAIPGLKVILAVNVVDEGAVSLAVGRARDADAIILDTYDPVSGRHGATGKTHDWPVSRRVVAQCPVPVILAGGLNPENVGEAIRVVRPWAVDVHTGVERADGTTDHAKVRAFVTAARGAGG